MSPPTAAADARSPRKCYACGGIGHIARVCPTLAAQKAENACLFTSGAVTSNCRSAGQLFSEAVVGGVRVTDALVDTGSALSMLSTAMYARHFDAPAIQPFSRAAPEVVGVGGTSAEIRGYVDMPIVVAGVAVRHPLLVIERLAFPVIIGTDILRAHGAVLALDESAPVRLRVRVCAVCREQRTASPAKPSSSARAAPCLQYCAPHSKLLPSRRHCKPRRDLNQRSAQSPLHLLSQPLRRQRALTPLLKRISRREHLLQLEGTRAHCLIRERLALFRRLARRQCCHRNHYRSSDRVVMLAAVHMRPRRNCSFPSLTVHKRREYPPSSTCE